MSKTITIIKHVIAMMVIFLSSPVFAKENPLSKASSINETEPFALANIMQMLAGLAFVVVLILLLGWFYRRFGTPSISNNSNFRIIAGLSMGQRERVVMLQVGDHQILLGVGPGHIEKIHVFDEPIINSEKSSVTGGFAERLATVIKQRGQR